MTAQQKGVLQKTMTDEMNHYNSLFTGGKAALGTEKYPDANAGLTAMDDPNSGASRFSKWRQDSKAEQDVSYIDTIKQVEAMYTTNHRPDTVDTWRGDQPAMEDALIAWVKDAVSWQISDRTDAELAADEAAFHATAQTVQGDITKVMAES
jgi:predicted 3-demethylubiquinone-9 3-methyltransferase (glyoxalase superfamily)